MKRLIEIYTALLCLVFLSPLLLFIAFMVNLKLGSPIIYKQLRPGYKGRVFTFYKFRTMVDKCDSSGALLPDKNRITTFGSFLRKTSLDELPSLWNVLKGDMSFVGPRPLLIEYLELYSSEQARRHDVKPGITGWAQINGRNKPTFRERIELDLWYLDNISLLLDVKIILITIKRVLARSDVLDYDPNNFFYEIERRKK